MTRKPFRFSVSSPPPAPLSCPVSLTNRPQTGCLCSRAVPGGLRRLYRGPGLHNDHHAPQRPCAGRSRLGDFLRSSPGLFLEAPEQDSLRCCQPQGAYVCTETPFVLPGKVCFCVVCGLDEDTLPRRFAPSQARDEVELVERIFSELWPPKYVPCSAHPNMSMKDPRTGKRGPRKVRNTFVRALGL